VAQAAQHRLPAPAPAPDTPTPLVSCPSPLPLSSLFRWQPGPARQTPRPAHDFTGAFAADHRPPRLLAINALTSSVGTMRPHSLCPSRPITPCLPESSRRQFAPSPPSWRARRRLPPLLPSPSPGVYKKDHRSSTFPTPASATSPSPSPSSIEPAPPPSLPSLVSSVLLSLVAFDQIALALKARHSVTSLAHTCSSPIAPGGLAGDFTAASACHPPWTGHPRPPPVKLTPPPRSPPPPRAAPPLPRRKTGLPAENRHGISPAIEPRPAPSPPVTVPRCQPPLSLSRGPAPTVSAASTPAPRGLSGPNWPQRRAPAPDQAGIPPDPVNLEFLFFFLFPFFFPFSHIYLYADILCTKNSLNKLWGTKIIRYNN
jgi:hypothetical protein